MEHKKGEAAQIERQQALRLRRSLMGVSGYACTLVLAVFAWLAGQLPGWVLGTYVVVMLVNNIAFLGMIRMGWNLHLARPDMTLPQVLLSIIPGLLVIYNVESSVTRAAFLLLALVPLIFGILGLDTRRSLLAGLFIYISYLAVVVALAVFEPQRLDFVGGGILLVAFFIAILQISLLGGHINELRLKLRSRNEKLNEALARIESLANHDDLTGVRNRRYLLGLLEQEALRCERGGESFAVCLFDIDHFKQVNDVHGHLAGDRVLVAVAEICSRNIRKIDCLGRYGGEEFLLIMPATDAEGAVVKAERLREAVSGLCFEELDPELRITTLSGGIAVYRKGEPFTAMLGRADQALYRAKAEGRNRIFTAPG